MDMYMPDFKFWEPATAKRLAKAESYVDVAKTAIKEMHRQVCVAMLVGAVLGSVYYLGVEKSCIDLHRQ